MRRTMWLLVVVLGCSAKKSQAVDASIVGMVRDGYLVLSPKLKAKVTPDKNGVRVIKGSKRLRGREAIIVGIDGLDVSGAVARREHHLDSVPSGTLDSSCEMAISYSWLSKEDALKAVGGEWKMYSEVTKALTVYGKRVKFFEPRRATDIGERRWVLDYMLTTDDGTIEVFEYQTFLRGEPVHCEGWARSSNACLSAIEAACRSLVDIQ